MSTPTAASGDQMINQDCDSGYKAELADENKGAWT